MKKKTLILSCVILAFLQCPAREFDYTYEGYTITYTVLDEDAKTVEVKADEWTPYPPSWNNVGRALKLPEHPIDGNVEYTLTAIGEYAFVNRTRLTSVTIPNSVAYIGEGAFLHCENLTSVTIPNSVVSIGKEAFSVCLSLTSVTIPNSVTYIGEGAFDYCQAIEEIEIPNSITRINDYTFSSCKNLRKVVIPNSVTSIGSGAFCDCSLLLYGSNFVIPNSVTSIGSAAFSGCYFSGLIIPNSVISIGMGAFSYCRYLSWVSLGNSIESIGKGAFSECRDLTWVTIPDMNKWARIKFGDGNSNPLKYASSLDIGDDLKDVWAYDLVIEGEEPISAFAFYGASVLRKVRVKDGASIGESAFYGCSNITEVCLNSDSIADNAFEECPNLYKLYVPHETAPYAPDNTFSYYDLTLYVPDGCISEYKNAETCWPLFLYMEESDFADIDTIFAPGYNNESGIEDIENDRIISNNGAGTNDIYNLQGICIKRNATEEDVKGLETGLYIIGGKKILVK